MLSATARRSESLSCQSISVNADGVPDKPSAYGDGGAVGRLRTMTNGDSLLVVFLSGDTGEGSAGPSVVALRFPRTEGLTGPPCLSCMRAIELAPY